MNVAIVIPARDEAQTIGDVVREVRRHVPGGTIIVADNGSHDPTADLAREAGAHIVPVAEAGYGRACNAGADAAVDADVLVFMDGDGSDRPEDIPALLRAIDDGADLAIGVRDGPGVEAGAIAPAARFGNWLSGGLIGLLWGRRLHDLSPLKAVRREVFASLGLREQTYGWTVEMLAKAVARGHRVDEVTAGYRQRRGGVSKVSGNVRASTKAGARILATIGRTWAREAGPVTLGGAAGAVVGLGIVLVFGLWLTVQGPSSARVWVAPWLVAWPVTVTGLAAGMLAGWVLRATRGGGPTARPSRNPS